jgi:hypothetical protein
MSDTLTDQDFESTIDRQEPILTDLSAQLKKKGDETEVLTDTFLENSRNIYEHTRTKLLTAFSRLPRYRLWHAEPHVMTAEELSKISNEINLNSSGDLDTDILKEKLLVLTAEVENCIKWIKEKRQIADPVAEADVEVNFDEFLDFEE